MTTIRFLIIAFTLRVCACGGGGGGVKGQSPLAGGSASETDAVQP